MQRKVQQGKSYGAIAVLKSVADEVEITQDLGNSKESILTLWQVIIGRVLFTKLKTLLVKSIRGI